MVLFHSRGESNPFKTILTENELCQILTEMRDNYEIVFEEDGAEDVEG